MASFFTAGAGGLRSGVLSRVTAAAKVNTAGIKGLATSPLPSSSSNTKSFSTTTSLSSHQQLQSQTTNTNKMSTSADLITLLQNRRSHYQLSASSPIPDSKIQEIVKEVLKHSPSSFNSQTTRIVVLFKEEHVQLWDLVKTTLKGVVPEGAWEATEGRLTGFQRGYGTVLFFDDRSTIHTYQEKFAIYADRFPGWAAHSNGFTQIAIWTALEAEGLGANLQHYNPLIDQKVTEKWGLSKDWELSAQLVFGKKEAEAGEKTYLGLEERVKVFGA